MKNFIFFALIAMLCLSCAPKLIVQQNEDVLVVEQIQETDGSYKVSFKNSDISVCLTEKELSFWRISLGNVVRYDTHTKRIVSVLVSTDLYDGYLIGILVCAILYAWHKLIEK